VRKLLIAVAAIAATVVVPTSAIASPSAHAAQVARLKARVASLMPAAQRQVAIAAAEGGISTLVNQVMAMPMPAPRTSSPQQYALLQALQPYATTTNTAGGPGGTVAPDGPGPLPASAAAADVRAHAASCYGVGQGPSTDRVNFYEGSIKVGWAEKDHGYWCGNGYSITDLGGANFGYYHKTWTPDLTPYCIVLPFNVNGWDAPHAQWAHGGLTAHEGNYTPWTSCVTFLSGNAVVRIAANGYWDRYWDF